MMYPLRFELHMYEKMLKEMFLTTDVQTILASGSEDFSVSRLVELADMILEGQRFQPTSIAQLSSFPLPTPNAHLVTPIVAMTAEMALNIFQLARFISRRSSSHSSKRHRSHS
ncbi:unnamed protein product [Schistocephalus solidus]|uniref:Uncharacterized protein n=1 Tax=Schistocephalus solidus TaxID=70667 RepID=A0A183SPG8_SCHSO|nr:unnamed protein product [Schistocephalus solidus]